MLIGVLAVSAAMLVAEVNGGTGGGIYLDLLNVQWWQAIVAIIVGLGLSPAPWITALATGRLLFRADLERQLAKNDEVHDAAFAAQETNHATTVAAQRAYYEALLTGKDERYAELNRSNQANADAAERNRQRADDVMDAALEIVDVVKANTHALAAFPEARQIAERTAQES